MDSRQQRENIPVVLLAILTLIEMVLLLIKGFTASESTTTWYVASSSSVRFVMCSVTVRFSTSLSANFSLHGLICLQLPILFPFLYRAGFSGILFLTVYSKVNLTVMFSSNVPLTSCIDSTEIKTTLGHFNRRLIMQMDSTAFFGGRQDFNLCVYKAKLIKFTSHHENGNIKQSVSWCFF